MEINTLNDKIELASIDERFHHLFKPELNYFDFLPCARNHMAILFVNKCNQADKSSPETYFVSSLFESLDETMGEMMASITTDARGTVDMLYPNKEESSVKDNYEQELFQTENEMLAETFALFYILCNVPGSVEANEAGEEVLTEENLELVPPLDKIHETISDLSIEIGVAMGVFDKDQDGTINLTPRFNRSLN